MLGIGYMVSQRGGDKMGFIFGGKSIDLVGDKRMSKWGVETVGQPLPSTHSSKHFFDFPSSVEFIDDITDMRMSKWRVEIDGHPLPSQIHSITEQWPPVDKKDDNVYPCPKIERDKDLFVDFFGGLEVAAYIWRDISCHVDKECVGVSILVANLPIWRHLFSDFDKYIWIFWKIH